MFDSNLKAQVSEYLKLMQAPLVIKINHSNKEGELHDFLRVIQECSHGNITLENAVLRMAGNYFEIHNKHLEKQLNFAMVPTGHEFSSFIMACLQLSGRPPKIEESLMARIKALRQPHKFESFISLSCHNCPEVVQALNTISVLNSNIEHTAIDGASHQNLVAQRDVMAVPCVFEEDQEPIVFSGKHSIEEIVSKLESLESIKPQSLYPDTIFDVLVIGAGPAGITAAIYASRKGLKTAIVAQKIGGQVNDTVGIENFISQVYTEGPQLVSQLETHLKSYPVEKFTGFSVDSVIDTGLLFEVNLSNRAVIKSKTIIVAAGAKWRNLNIPGEEVYKNKGVAYCPHCDGPFFKNKNIAVIGGGNSGVEAAIDLAGIVNHVTVVEYGAQLRADAVLQSKLEALRNIKVVKNAQTLEIKGDSKVKELVYKDLVSGSVNTIPLEGIFVQIGLVPNTDFLGTLVSLNKSKEIMINHKGATSHPRIFAAGDCTDVAYKQIVVALGEGAKAALSCFESLAFS